MTAGLDTTQPSTDLEPSHTPLNNFSRADPQSFNGGSYASDEDAMTGITPARRTPDSRPRFRRSHLPSVASDSLDTPSSRSRPSNRLVKRSASRSVSHGSQPPSSLGKRDSTRRPFTSHQRDYPQDSNTDSFAYDSDILRHDWHPLQFFTPRISKTPLNLSSFSGPPFIRRISPDGRYPALLSGSVVSGTDIDLDEALNHLVSGEFSAAKSTRPATPAFSFSSPPQASSYVDASNERGPRRSFSFTRLLIGKSLGFRQASTTSKQSPRRTRGTSKRISSAPEKTQSGMSEEGERPAKKRGTHATYADSPGVRSVNFSSRTTTSGSRPHTSDSRPSRLSATPSELTSSQVGSDTGTGVFSSADEDELDFQSDTVYDSMRTGMTKNSDAGRSRGLETLFDNPDDLMATPNKPEVRGLSHDIASSPPILHHGRRRVSEDDGSASTPARTVVGQRQDSHAPGSPRTAERSSPPSSFHPDLHFGAAAFPRQPSQEEINWSDGEDWDRLQDSPTPHHATKTLAWLDGSTPRVARRGPSSTFNSSPRDFEAKINPFDWSEQPVPSANDSPPRPKTEHGKKPAESRVSRPSGRAPSGFHARSTSVPVVPDVKTKVTNKFGTWGIGSKGVSEDWDDDFAFELPSVDGSETSEEVSRPNTATTMHVPLGIREAQINVVANISLVREWGLLIEELKELRARAVTLGVRVQDNSATFEEVDAMIELADLDHEEGPSEAALGQEHSPFASSPRFSFDDIDETAPVAGAAQSPLRTLSKADEDDVFQSPPAVTTPQRAAATHSQAGQALAARPRKNSEAVALSVIEELHRRRGAADPKINRGPKMEFDTATLKNIVPYVNGLMRQFKEILRTAEGLATTPRHKSRRSEDPAFSQAFIEPGTPASPTARKGRRPHMDDDTNVGDLGRMLNGTLHLT